MSVSELAVLLPFWLDPLPLLAVHIKFLLLFNEMAWRQTLFDPRRSITYKCNGRTKSGMRSTTKEFFKMRKKFSETSEITGIARYGMQCNGSTYASTQAKYNLTHGLLYILDHILSNASPIIITICSIVYDKVSQFLVTESQDMTSVHLVSCCFSKHRNVCVALRSSGTQSALHVLVSQVRSFCGSYSASAVLGCTWTFDTFSKKGRDIDASGGRAPCKMRFLGK